MLRVLFVWLQVTFHLQSPPASCTLLTQLALPWGADGPSALPRLGWSLCFHGPGRLAVPPPWSPIHGGRVICRNGQCGRGPLVTMHLCLEDALSSSQEEVSGLPPCPLFWGLAVGCRAVWVWTFPPSISKPIWLPPRQGLLDCPSTPRPMFSSRRMSFVAGIPVLPVTGQGQRICTCTGVYGTRGFLPVPLLEPHSLPHHLAGHQRACWSAPPKPSAAPAQGEACGRVVCMLRDMVRTLLHATGVCSARHSLDTWL